MKALICGPRDWVDQKPVEDILRLFPLKDMVIIHGGQRGVDNIAGFVAKDLLGLNVRSYPVNHKLDGPWPRAGPQRNLRMLTTEHPFEVDGTLVDFGVAFKRKEVLTPGTSNMVSLLKARSIPVLEVLCQRGVWSIYSDSLKIELTQPEHLKKYL